jgi:hypothetical protein
MGILCALFFMGCANMKLFRSDPPVGPEHLTKMRTLQAAIATREAECATWASNAQDLVSAIQQNEGSLLKKSKLGKVHQALRKYPGLPPETLELVMIYLSAPNTPGFPKDYRWNWTAEIPGGAQQCRLMTWATLAKGAILNRRPDSAKNDRLLLRQITTESRKNLHLVRHLIHLAVVKSMLEQKRIRMKPSVRMELDGLEAASNELRHRIQKEGSSREKLMQSRCNVGKGEGDIMDLDCPSEVEAELYGLYGDAFAVEFRETAVLSEKLVTILSRASVKKK